MRVLPGRVDGKPLACLRARRSRADRLRLVRGPAAADAGRPVREAGGDRACWRPTSSSSRRTCARSGRSTAAPSARAGSATRFRTTRSPWSWSSSTSTTSRASTTASQPVAQAHRPGLRVHRRVRAPRLLRPVLVGAILEHSLRHRRPPGLIGSGSGIGTGGYYLGPFDGQATRPASPTRARTCPASGTTTRTRRWARRRTSLPAPVASWRGRSREGAGASTRARRDRHAWTRPAQRVRAADGHVRDRALRIARR